MTPVLYSCKTDAWKIADFGFTAQGSSRTACNTENPRGTPGYRAPELVITGVFNNKSDIWTLGCVWFEVMSQEKAFNDDLTVRDFAYSAGRKTVTRTDGCWDDAMDCLLHTLLDADPTKRPSATELLDSFEALFEDEKIE